MSDTAFGTVVCNKCHKGHKSGESCPYCTRTNTEREEFEKFFTPENQDKPEIHGGFALCHWAGSTEEEEQIQKDHKVTIRCIPFGDEYAEEGTCFFTGKPSSRRVVFAKSY